MKINLFSWMKKQSPLSEEQALTRLGLLEKVLKFDKNIFDVETALMTLLLKNEISSEQYNQYRNLVDNPEKRTIFDSLYESVLSGKYHMPKKRDRKMVMPEYLPA
jgi:hypothetical protein